MTIVENKWTGCLRSLAESATNQSLAGFAAKVRVQVLDLGLSVLSGD